MRANSTPMRSTVHATLLLAAIACDATTPVEPTRDGGVAPPPEFDIIRQPLEGVVDPLAERPITFAAGLDDGTILADGPDGLLRVDTATVVELGADAGAVRAVAMVDGTPLVGGSFGLFAVVGDAMQPSPIVDVIGGVVATDLAIADGRVWIASQRGLSVWSSGTSASVAPDGLPTADAELSFGARVGGVPAMWVLSAGRVYGLTLDGAKAYPQTFGADIRSLATATDGTLWIVERGGILRSRRLDGTFRERDAIRGAVRVVAARDGAVWIETVSEVWRHFDGAFQEVQGAVRPLLEAANDGSVLAGADRLVRVFPELRVDFDGVDEGALLLTTTTITLRPLLPERITSLTATLDDAAIEAGTGPWSVTVDPTTLTDGTHTLKAVATYDDGRTAESSLRFSYFAGPVPNWTDDVAPLMTAHCEVCHGERASARPLDTFELWQAEIDLILFNVREGRMPLMPNRPLNAAEIAAIEGWAAAGFPLDGE